MTMLISYQMLIQKQLTYECDVPLTMFPIIIIWGPTFVKKRAKKVLAERSAGFPPNMMIAISSILDSHFFWHKFRWFHHGIFTFQIPFKVTINGGVLTCHWWTKNSHVLNFIVIGFSLYFSSLLRHIRHIIITTGY